ncbi:MAG: hypothetical protein ACE5K9_11790 [Candidatus Methylomirabilales bacterium]
MAIAEDIEVQSLGLLRGIKSHIVLIGGWGVRAWTQDIAARNTMDVDAFGSEEDLTFVASVMAEQGLSAEADEDWGVRFYKDYVPTSIEAVKEADEIKDLPGEIELRVEVSGPRITEKRSPHYFEFDPAKAVVKGISSRRKTADDECRVADIDELAANKIGLPADYKNMFDLALLLQQTRVEPIVEIIKSVDDWQEMVIRRIPKVIGRVQRGDNTANVLMRAFGLDVGDFVKQVLRIRSSIT